MIQIQRLEGFYRVARAEGYARAVRDFPYPITQPGIHQQVKRLEAELGVVLFERIAKDRVVLTAPGQMLYEHVAPFFEGLTTIVHALRDGKIGGTLRIRAASQALRLLLPPWVRSLQVHRPDIRVEVAEMADLDLPALRSGRVDLLVDYLDEVPDDVSVRQVATSKPFVVAPASHRLASRERVSLADLKQEPFIAYNTDQRLRELQLRALSWHEVSPKIAHMADSTEAILAFVAAGLGVSLVGSIEAHGPQSRGVVTWPLLRPVAAFPIYAIWRKTRRDNPAIAAALALAPHVPRARATPGRPAA